MGDSNNLEGLSLHGIRLRNVWGWGISLEGESNIIHQAVDEGLLGEWELSCAKDGLCMMEDVHSVTVFGGQL